MGSRGIGVARQESGAFVEAAVEAGDDAAGALVFRARDLADITAIPTLVREIKREFGPICGLVNNAGLGTAGLLATMADPSIEALIRLNTLSPIPMSKYVVRGMMENKRGRIVNMASVVAATGSNALSVYGATKASLVGFMKSVARQVGRLGVTVNAIAPGLIDTEMTHDLGEADRERVVSRAALKRLTSPEDIAATAEFLLGEGGRNITGIVLTVDAGATA